MATKKTTTKKTTAKKDTPAGYDRWDTFTGTIKMNKPSPELRKKVEKYNAELAAKTKKK